MKVASIAFWDAYLKGDAKAVLEIGFLDRFQPPEREARSEMIWSAPAERSGDGALDLRIYL